MIAPNLEPGRRSMAFSLLAFLLLVPWARGDVTYVEGERGGLRPTVVRMTVSPAAAPSPALKHRLIARDIDLKPGNAAPYYYRTFIAARRGRDVARQEFPEDELSRWYTTGQYSTPLSELPLARLQRAVELTSGGSILRELAEATSRRECDWQLGIRELRGPQIIVFELDEFQHGREITRVLSLRTRLALAQRRYDDAIDSMRMNYRLARDTASEPLLVCGLIGIAQAMIMNGPLVELIAAPDSPNMYWALKELPEPFVDLRPAVRFEGSFAARIFPFLKDAETAERSPDEWNRLYQQMIRDLPSIRGAPGFHTPNHELGAALLAMAAYPHAKSQLIEQGLDRAKVEQMSVGQVIADYTQRVTQRMTDEFEKLSYMPFWEARVRAAEVDKRLRDMNAFQGGADREVVPLVTVLSPSIHAAREAQVRLDRELAALRVIEALRMYAASHDGKLPERLNAISEVPIPLNPATGQPFVYRLDGETAILELPAEDGFGRDGRYNRRFEISIKH
ncbi:MAG: hypothetical protein WD669_11335 [Pirellulales bacterium]